ncbi:aldehyde dehydrogenase family 3 member H1 isoform X2 [Physcomitrium patens]|uniref:aldehyde dehydrogenase family 3 member H1 isoform X2 n=1 Tax=Physcomitrium patens TaxID=3218 RepID=UPI003CCC93AD
MTTTSLALAGLPIVTPDHSSQFVLRRNGTACHGRIAFPTRVVAGLVRAGRGYAFSVQGDLELQLRRRSCNFGRGGKESVGVSQASAADVVVVKDDMKVGGRSADHGDERVLQLVAEVREAYMTMRTKPAEWRVQQLKGLLRMVIESESEIVEALYADLGKPAHESYMSEISLVKSSCKLAIKELKKWMAPQRVSGSMITFPSSASIVAEPLGVTLVISAWNFPFLLSVDPLIGAISAGCAVVLKPSEVVYATPALLAKLIPLYMDNSVIRVVEGNPKVGRIVMAAASKHLTPVTLELGGKCPVYFDRSANLKVGLRRIAQGKWGNNNGQACISPDYILVDESIASELVDNLKEIIETFYGKNPISSTNLSRIVNTKHYLRLISFLEDPQICSKIVHGGERDEKKLYIAPTLVCDALMDSFLMSEEIFGPILPIIKVQGEQEAIDIINARPKPLAAYVFTTNKAVEERMVKNVSSGGMVVNDTVMHFVNPGLPFGGVGESGMGSYHGKFSFDAFSHKKAVLYRTSLGDFPARYPPFTTKKQNFLRCVLDGDYIGAILSLTGLKK